MRNREEEDEESDWEDFEETTPAAGATKSGAGNGNGGSKDAGKVDQISKELEKNLQIAKLEAKGSGTLEYEGKSSWDSLNEEIKKESRGTGLTAAVLKAPTLNLDAKSISMPWESPEVAVEASKLWAPWTAPSMAQERVLPVFCRESDAGKKKREPRHYIVQVKNGAGKTGVFTMCSLYAADPNIKRTQVLIITNGFELTHAIWKKTVLPLCKNAGYPEPVVLSYGEGDNASRHESLRMEAAARSPIVVAQSGFLAQKALKNKAFCDALKSLKLVIFDEADEMLKGTKRNMLQRLQRLFKSIAQRMTGDKRAGPDKFTSKVSTFFISATFTSDEKKALTMDMFGNRNVVPIIIHSDEQLDVKKMALIHVDFKNTAAYKTQEAYNKTVHFFLNKLDAKSSIVFCNKKTELYAMKKYLEEEALMKVGVIHGRARRKGEPDMTNEGRLQALADFRAQKTKILLATSAIARGIDIPTVEVVVLLGVPIKYVDGKPMGPDSEQFRHRVGRTARFGRKGVAVAVTHSDGEQRALGGIIREMKLPEGRVKSFPVEKIDTDAPKLQAIVQKLLGRE